MNPYYYDLHLHTCLSPCGDAAMTPPNIAGFAALAGLSLIAVCDHNTAGNARAVQQAAAELAPGLLVIAGLELTCAEEIHAVCLFPSADLAEAASDEVYSCLPDIRNREAVFGPQIRMDKEERELTREERLLITATTISIDDAADFAACYGGFCFPAHIDRSSQSVLSALGELPESLPFTTVEVANPDAFFADAANRRYAERYHILTDSDAHRLEEIRDASRAIHLPELSFEALRTVLMTPKE